MEIEEIWNGLPGFKGIQKGAHGKIGYGCRYKCRKPYEKCRKRKAYRQIRKYGFDLSELWNLDNTILEWLSDNVGGFFRVCGPADDWSDYYTDGQRVNWRKDISDSAELLITRSESFQKHLRDFLDNGDPVLLDKFGKFVVPRLLKLADITHGWPVGEDFPKFEDWTAEVRNMAAKFEEGIYSEYFITYFFSLWD